MSDSTSAPTGFVVEPSDAIDLLDLFDAPAGDLHAATGTVTEAGADVALLRLADGSTATLPASEFYPNKRWQPGARYNVAVLPVAGSTRPICSTTRPELIELLAAGIVPELRSGEVRVLRVVRHVGIRSKIAVAATAEGVDPVGAFVGRAANRVAQLSRMLEGERVDIVAWNPDPAIFLQNALGVRVSSVSVGEKLTVVSVPAHQLTAAIGGGGLNAALAARLTGLRISIVADDAA